MKWSALHPWIYTDPPLEGMRMQHVGFSVEFPELLGHPIPMIFHDLSHDIPTYR